MFKNIILMIIVIEKWIKWDIKFILKDLSEELYKKSCVCIDLLICDWYVLCCLY